MHACKLFFIQYVHRDTVFCNVEPTLQAFLAQMNLLLKRNAYFFPYSFLQEIFKYSGILRVELILRCTSFRRTIFTLTEKQPLTDMSIFALALTSIIIVKIIKVKINTHLFV